jgi:hypothetical protein
VSYLIGTDEAGYGPNLGPLVVSATVWEVPDGTGPGDLYRLLDGLIAPAPGDAGDGRLCLADSKRLYQPGRGLRLLERGLLGAIGVLGHRPAFWRDAWDMLAPAARDTLASVPWYADYHAPVPVDADGPDAEAVAAALGDGLQAAGVRLLGVRSRAVFPAEFNRLCQEHGTKGAALSHVTLALAAELSRPLEAGPISVVCDKHGGRNRYADLLADHFPDDFIEIRGESRARSVYCFGPPERRFEFRFQAKGESHLQAALASMASKYLRELAMLAFNHFWCSRVPGLKPTAGYPQDARRFKTAIAIAQAELGIEDKILWRRR